MVKKLGMIVVAFILMQFSINLSVASASVFDNKVSENKTEVSPQVTHIKRTYQSSSTKEVVNMLDINLADTYTKLEIGLPNPMNSLKTTSGLAKEYSTLGHRVVGAVNASYFMGNGVPANLLAHNNEIMNYGILGDGSESPTQNPIAFGISKSGKAIIDYYNADLSFTVNGKEYPIDLINSERTTNKTVLYTPGKKSTGTNQWGIEIVANSATQNTTSLHFGDQFSGVVSKVTGYNTAGDSVIPSDGFVISVQNKELAAEIAASVSAGATVEVGLAIDQKWMDAEYILAAGPLLVKDSKVNISMSTSSEFARTLAPRTAVAIDSTGTKVFLVTVDGRQSGYSNGTSLSDLASYLISQGASAAINLDGGGSTTMVVRNPGGYYPRLVNSPSDGSERRVSAILQVVNTAPQGTLKSMTLGSIPSEVVKGGSINLKVASAYDDQLNPIELNSSQVKWSVEGNIGTINGTTFTATANGQGKIIAQYGSVEVEKSVKVIGVEDKILLDSFDSASKWSSSAAKATASVANSSKSEPYRQGSSSLRLTYDFSTSQTGTKAAYAVAKSPIPMTGRPNHLGVWVYGDGGNHWLRGVIVDGAGSKHTIDFTGQGELNWTGWKYVTAEVPSDISLPIKFERLYIAEPSATHQNKGKVYFDQLQAVYNGNYKEPAYSDVKNNHWAISSIENLNEQELIKGYIDGTFRPTNSITRAEAATIIARALNLKATKTISFEDVRPTNYAAEAISALAEKGIMTGRTAGKFTPDGKLTRAEVATVVKRAYDLKGTTTVSYRDLEPTHWAYGSIQTLVANDLVKGFTDNTFRPDVSISRAEFATFLDRVN
ncbi:S-layer homology domain-containing protein [Ureibacillus aquaedulcis]|uniref:S-layer homology domain-containing protein n=1 Tax=Ureibacillus aquaedulcis TaxID=3058421 RepID=A0ABT8GLC7_9BACL|nr:S-layer homology domain-containing protein [Ureibacillus sp. BA0131]MDN4492169.1 S-layer homology domain-containing protein [Ureibacillus sp. BA0131]